MPILSKGILINGRVRNGAFGMTIRYTSGHLRHDSRHPLQMPGQMETVSSVFYPALSAPTLDYNEPPGITFPDCSLGPIAGSFLLLFERPASPGITSLI